MYKLLYITLIAVLVNVGFTGNLFAETKFSKPRSYFDEGSKIKLIIGDKVYELQSYSLSYRPKRKEKIEKKERHSIVLPSAAMEIFEGYDQNVLAIRLKVSKLDLAFIEWILSQDQQAKDGQIVISDAETGKITRTITLKGMTSNSYSESSNTGYNDSLAQSTSLNLNFSEITIKF